METCQTFDACRDAAQTVRDIAGQPLPAWLAVIGPAAAEKIVEALGLRGRERYYLQPDGRGGSQARQPGAPARRCSRRREPGAAAGGGSRGETPTPAPSLELPASAVQHRKRDNRSGHLLRAESGGRSSHLT